jgi:hypothetical protein
MAAKTGKKYAKYIIEYSPKMEENNLQVTMGKTLGITPPMETILRLDKRFAEGCHFYWVSWFTPERPFPLDIGHPPHIHKDAELLFHIGTDPKNPTDLGAECEIYLGEEMERYLITKTCAIWIPAGFIHSPWKPLVTRRPWIFIEVNQGTMHTEKGFHHLIPQEMQKKYPEEMKRMSKVFADEGY